MRRWVLSRERSSMHAPTYYVQMHTRTKSALRGTRGINHCGCGWQLATGLLARGAMEAGLPDAFFPSYSGIRIGNAVCARGPCDATHARLASPSPSPDTLSLDCRTRSSSIRWARPLNAASTSRSTALAPRARCPLPEPSRAFYMVCTHTPVATPDGALVARPHKRMTSNEVETTGSALRSLGVPAATQVCGAFIGRVGCYIYIHLPFISAAIASRGFASVVSYMASD